jgi:hypothetical protein
MEEESSQVVLGFQQDEHKCMQLEVGAHLCTPWVESAVTQGVVSLRMT